MSAKAKGGGGKDRVRMQMFCSARQREILLETAKGSGTDVHTYVIGHAMLAAGRADDRGSPLMIYGDAADRVRDAAAKQGIDAAQLVDQLLVAASR